MTFPAFPSLEIDFSANCHAADVKEFHAYWLSKHDGNIPSWPDISLMDIYRLAPNVMVKEMIDGGIEWRNRYFGTGLTRLLGVEGTNKLLADYHDAETTANVCRFFNEICGQARPMRVFGRCTVEGRNYKNLEGVYLPVSDRNGAISIVMCYEAYGE